MPPILLFCASALAGELPGPTDLDGDGKPEVISLVQDTGYKVGAATLECSLEFGGCELRVVDLKGDDKRKELELCSRGPRDERLCALHVYDKGKLVELEPTIKGQRTWPSAFEVPVTGFLYADYQYRIYTRREKFTLGADGRTLTQVPQPFYHVDQKLHVDRTFPITARPDGGPVVANARPNSDVTLILESGETDDLFLVRLSSGLVGWVSLETLLGASDRLQMVYGAG